ncbi:trypco2 family protein [Streptomyces sp. NPDC059496]|uniref:trypco2 family protein n=1 Tax=Streptomyces sp. NPDC059496 TaxID=3346851 RepID=UPI0036775ADD
MADEPWVGLADAVRGVRAELRAAMAEGQDADLRFDVGPVELEFAVDVRKDGAVDVKARVYVVSFGAKGGGSTASTHRLKLTLNPVDAQGKPVQVSTQVPAIPGE